MIIDQHLIQKRKQPRLEYSPLKLICIYYVIGYRLD